MRRIRCCVGLGGIAAAAILVGCGGVAGTPFSTSHAPSARESATVSSHAREQKSQLPYAGAPKVSDPIDVSKYAEAPCSVVTQQQRQVLHLPEGETAHDTAPSCNWIIDNPDSSTDDSYESKFEMSVSFELTGKGLSLLYSQKDADYADLSDKGEVNGFPVLRYVAKKSHRRGDCVLVVGATDKQVVSVDIAGKSVESDPCSMPRSLVKAATATIRKGA